MIWQETPYTIPLIVISTISIILGLFIWFRRRTPRLLAGSLIILANSEWMLSYALELASADLPTKILWDKVQFLGVVTVPTMWFVYILYYTGHERWLTRRASALLLIVPFITLLLTFTNEAHGLIWTSYSLDTSGPFSVLHNTYGLWLWIFIGYAYILTLIGASLLVRMFVYSRSLYRWQTSALLFGALAPMTASALVAFGLNPSEYLDLTPFFFVVTNITVGFSIIYFRLEDIVPLARETIIESMDDSIIVLDAENRIVDINPSAQRLIDGTISQFIGQPIEEVWPEWSRTMEPIHAEKDKEVVLDCGNEQRIYDVSISPLIDWGGRTISQIVVLRDITDRKRSEKIKASLKEKEILLQEIHHRVKNNLQIVSSLLNLQSQYIKDKKYAEMLRESQNRIKSMALIHERLYQSENLAKINLNEYIKTLVHTLIRSYKVSTERIELQIDVEDVSFGIDAAIPCGLIINELVSNSLKHAFPDRKGKIAVILHSVDGIIELTVSDNGVGIPEDIDFKNTETLGLRLVTILAEDQLNGKVNLIKSKGTTFHITFKE
ncbi:MAG: PAS domain-containing protein [Theionarchaea archaeon]|nr:PAS domain-containing protein [Theionarchaea archaeon]